MTRTTSFRAGLAALLVSLGAASAAPADEIALVVSNTDGLDFTERREVEAGHEALVDLYRLRGYRTLQGENLDRGEILRLLEGIEGELDETETLVIQFTGRAVSAGGVTGLLPDDAAIDSRTAALTETVPLALLFDLAAELPGRSVVALGLGGQAPASAEDFADDTLAYTVPQGVLLVTGRPQAVARTLRDEMLGYGRAASEIDALTAGVRFEGLVSDQLRLAPPGSRPPLPEPPKTPEEIAAETEAALGLTLSQRRVVQTDLTVLGFDTRGVDGIFGSGTRSAVRAWQRAAGEQETGYLTEREIGMIGREANIRREEIRLEEQRRAREARLADDAYWRQTGASGERRDLQAYLARYPDGRHAPEARSALAKLNATSERNERQAWETARKADTLAAYNAFLREYPDGRFSDRARDRRNTLRGSDETRRQIERHRKTERSLDLTAESVTTLEARLKRLGFDPGPADGRVDRDTRRAIANFQLSQGLTPTGYFNSATVQRILIASSG